MGFTLNQHEQEKQIKKLQKKKDQDTTNYNDLDNLPQINSVELKGDKSLSDLGIQSETLEAASGESLTLSPTSEGMALIHTVYGMSTQDGTPTPSSPVDIVSAKADFTSTHGQDSATVTTDLTLRAIEVTSSDDYNLVRDNKYYIADTLDYTDDDGFVVTRRVEEFSIDGTEQGWSYIDTVGSERFSITLNALNLPADKYIGKDISSHFQEKRNGVIIDNSQPWGYFRIGIDGWFVLTDNDNTIGTLSAFKTWLGENTPHFMYCLATPTTENITTAQALALLGLKTYDESTTISSQAEPACTVAVEYAKEKLGAVALTAYNKAVADGLNITAITPHILPDAPTTDGSYNLKVTVTSGEAAYSWEAVTP